jgi:transglutaminase-like putative cysteine protease
VFHKGIVKRIGSAGQNGITLIFSILGVLGLLAFPMAFPGVMVHNGVIYLTVVVACTILWYAKYFGRDKLKLFIPLLLLAITATLTAVMGSSISDSFRSMVDVIQGDTTGQLRQIGIESTGLIAVTAVMLTLFLYLADLLQDRILLSKRFCRFPIRNILFTGVAALLTYFSPLVGVRVGTISVMFLLLCLVGFWMRRPQVNIVMGLILIAFFIALPIANTYADDFYQAVYTVEGYFVRTRAKLSGESSELILGGAMTYGNVYRTGTDHLELEVPRQPTQPLYLRGFSGGTYEGGEWLRSNDDAIVTEITLDNSEDPNPYRKISLYNSLYYNVNEITRSASQGKSIALNIVHFNEKYGNSLVPYYSRRVSAYYDAADEDPWQDGYSYNYFEQKDVMLNWNNAPGKYAAMAEEYQTLQRDYYAVAKTIYTQVPEESVPGLTAFARANPRTDLNDITAFILYTLHTDCTYTLTPGWYPINEDVADAFFFRRRTGFCEHFALTATLLYRLYGIPARYATGYRILPEDFVQNEKGIYAAIATDEAAHAWVEIFIPDYGWTPVEVTPGAEGATLASFPGFTQADYQTYLTSADWQERFPRIVDTMPDLNDEDTSPQMTTGASNTPNREEMEHARIIILTCLIYTLLLLPVFLDYRRLRFRQNTDRMNARQLFTKLITMLHTAGYLREYDGTEADFVSALIDAIPGLNRSEADRLYSIVNIAAYGREVTDTQQTTLWEDTDFVKRIYRQIAAQISTELPLHQKLLFRYRKTSN